MTTAKRLILKALATNEPLTVAQIAEHTKVRRATIDMTLSRLRQARAVVRVGTRRRSGQHQITERGRDMLRGKVDFDAEAVVALGRQQPNWVFALGRKMT